MGRGGKGQREVRRDGEQWRVIGSGEKGPGVVGRNRERWGGTGRDRERCGGIGGGVEG